MQMDKDEHVDGRLGPLPVTAYVLARESDGYNPDRLLNEPGYTAEHLLEYAAQQVAAERERCAAIAEAWGDYRGILAEVGPRIGRAIRGA